MALINCKECRTEVSDQANACPRCGFPVAKSESIRIRHEIEQMKVQKQLEDHEKLQEYVLKNLMKYDKPVSLTTINGLGFRMLGFYPLLTHEGKNLGLSLHTLCFFFIPILPFGLYLNESLGNSYKFYGSVPMIGSFKVLGLRGSYQFCLAVLKDILIMIAVLIGIILIFAFIVYVFG